MYSSCCGMFSKVRFMNVRLSEYRGTVPLLIRQTDRKPSLMTNAAKFPWRDVVRESSRRAIVPGEDTALNA